MSENYVVYDRSNGDWMWFNTEEEANEYALQQIKSNEADTEVYRRIAYYTTRVEVEKHVVSE